MKFILLLLIALLPNLSFALDDDDEMLRTLEAERVKQVEQAVKLNQARENFEGMGSNMLDDLKKLGNNDFFEESFQHHLKEVMANNPMQTLSMDEVRSMLLERVKGRPAEKLFKKYPKTLDISAGILRDREALPALAGILNRVGDLKLYIYISLGLLVFSFLFKRIFFPRDWTFLRRVSMSVLLSLVMTGLSFGVFYYFFSKEVTPTIAVIRQHI
jgi:hypothetical protein